MIHILYISVVGNTRHFVHVIQHYAAQSHRQQATDPVVKLTEITDQTDLFRLTQPYFCFVPTYVEGGSSSMDLKMQSARPREIETLTMDDELGYQDNFRHCLGVVGSGNRNFNYLYCYTAKLYARKYHLPLLDNYELRGTSDDVIRIYNKMKQTMNK